MNIAKELEARGLVAIASAEAETILGKKRTVYLGIDPTADSMHAGNLLVVLFLKRLADAGHTIILLVGGGTGMIGDPKEKGERPLIDTKSVERNKKAIKAQFQTIIGKRVKLVDNADWLLKIKLVPFLRDIGKHFTINELVKRDIIKRRLATEDDSISYTEFAYSLLQGYDYLVLNDKFGCDLQIGASDQWTNILSGVELIRRKTGREAFALTTPLVTDASGKKFGKSEGNAIWLDPKKTSPYAFYQFWLNQSDEMVEVYLKFFTFLPVIEIEAMVELHKRNPGKREAQKTLARLVTEIVHGTESATRSIATSEALFGNKPVAELTPLERAVLLSEAPSLKISQKDLMEEYTVVDALVSGNLATSKTEARKLIEGRGVSINGTLVETVDELVSLRDLHGGLALLRRGKQVLVLVTS